MIFDISGLAEVKAGKAKSYTPRLLGRVEFHPPYTAWTHTFQPVFGRKMAWAADEATSDNCKDMPKLVWLVDIRAETHPVIIGTAPLHADDGLLCSRGGRFGAHNIHPNFPGPLYRRLENTTVSTWFNGGVRIYRMTPPIEGRPRRAAADRGNRLLHPRSAATEPNQDDSAEPCDRGRAGVDLYQRSVRRRALYPALHGERAARLTE